MRVPDGAYQSMISAIREDRTPNLLLLSYKQITWEVSDLLIIPHFAFSEQAIIPRKPLALTARRAGWIGCNIDLSQIAPEARIPIIQNNLVVCSSIVSDRFSKLKPLSQLKGKERGWTLAVLNAIQTTMLGIFSTQDVYLIEKNLTAIFPENKNIRPKIRQQLQVLRDLGLLTHLERGKWALRSDSTNSQP